jgi:hypothetical protein
MVWVRVSRFVNMIVKAKKTAEEAAVITPALIPSTVGRATIRMPTNPITAAKALIFVSFSPKINGDRTMTHKGEVNSSAKTCASGMTVTA